MQSPEFRSDMTVELVDSMGGDHSIARAARVSSGTTGTERRIREVITYLREEGEELAAGKLETILETMP